MKSSVIGNLFLLTACSVLSANDSIPAYSRNVEKWIEVSDSIYNEMENGGRFSNVCHWRVSLDGEVVFADPPETVNTFPPLKPSKNQNILIPGAIIKVSDGWLASYYREYANTYKIYWYSNDKSQKKFLRDALVAQFCIERTSGDVFAGSHSGILRFWTDKENKKWMSEQIVNFEFSTVSGIAPDWKGGFLVFARSGWYEVSKDRKVNRLESFDDITDDFPVSGTSIANKENRVFVGGQFFVSEINLDNRTVRRLCPSHKFLHAMRTLNRIQWREFFEHETKSK